jgi:hypothetical protein
MSSENYFLAMFSEGGQTKIQCLQTIFREGFDKAGTIVFKVENAANIVSQPCMFFDESGKLFSSHVF